MKTLIKENPSLFSDPGITYPDHDLALPFEEYITLCTSLITRYRLDLQDAKDPQKIILANSPFELKPTSPTKTGALLIHGLYDAPLVMRDIGNHLCAENILVRSILLPGHGTVPGGLLNVSYEDWLQSVNYGIASLEKDVEKIILVGFSTGANLALYHFLKNSNSKIAGIISLAPAIKLKSPIAFLSNWFPLIKKLYAPAAWFYQGPENDYAKYQSITSNSIYQVYRLAKELKKISTAISCPQLFVLTENDKTIDSSAALNYFKLYATTNSQLILYSNQSKKELDTRIILRTACYPKLNIVDFSHVALPTSPDNFHYGKQGDYIYASRIEEKSNIIYNTSNNIKNKLFYKFKLQNNQHLRLTYNPDFEFLCDTIKNFI